MFRYFVELIGTFIFLSVIIIAASANIKWAFMPIGLVLAVMVYWGGDISGGHYNPAVSTMFFAHGKLTLIQYIGYIICQVIGGLLALVYYINYHKVLTGDVAPVVTFS